MASKNREGSWNPQGVGACYTGGQGACYTGGEGARDSFRDSFTRGG